MTARRPVWIAGDDLIGRTIAQVLIRATDIEVVGPLPPSDPRLRAIPAMAVMVVRNTLVDHDDAWFWLQPLFDREPTLA
jgi:hypothetical protein